MAFNYDTSIKNILLSMSLSPYLPTGSSVGYGFQMTYDEGATASLAGAITMYDEGILSKYFKNNEKQREFFEEIILLRDVIRKNEEEIESLKHEEVQKFRKKYENYKASKNGNVIQLIYTALFGNGIHL